MTSPPHGHGSAQMKLPPPRRTLLRRLTLWAEQARALKGWIEAARRRSAALDATFETIERDSEIGGSMLSGALSYRLFVFALPLAFFVVSGLGLLASALGIETQAITSSVGLAGVVTKQVASSASGSSSWWVVLTSFFVLVYATRVFLRAVAITHSLAWERSAASVKVRSRSLGIFAAALFGQLLLVAWVWAPSSHQTVIGGIFALAAFVFALAGLWLIISLEVAPLGRRLDRPDPRIALLRNRLRGVVLFNILILGSLIETKTSTYGALGTAATLLLAFFLVGRVIVGAAVLNATLYERRSRSRDQQA